MDKSIQDEYQRWFKKAIADNDIIKELREMQDDKKRIEDAFYRNLAFGTGGLRGIIGAGTNRMNVYTVAKASQGLSDYIIKNFTEDKRKIAVSFDSRNKSCLFAKVASGVFAANGINVEIYKELMPTPCLSYAVRTLGCSAGIMITASHNPGVYNGYKVYGADGCQITTEAATNILEEVDKLDIFDNVNTMDFDLGIETGKISYISDDVYTSFIEEIKNQSLLFVDVEVDKDVSIVYSPLNGTGLKPVLRALRESGYTNITVVQEQEYPDGNFPTCPYPNPEIKEAMSLGIEYAKRKNADILLATDPDCDRVGIAVKSENGEYRLVSGNEVGMLLFDFICLRRKAMNKMPQDPVLIKTIVSIDMAERIAEYYGVRTINVLTGFKFIGEQIGILEASGKIDSFIFGFEESYGYLSNTHVRDKDAVDGAFMICEMLGYYKARGTSLLKRLNELYDKFGYCLNTLHSFEFAGVEGLAKMQKIMEDFRSSKEAFGEKKVIRCLDYSLGLDSLPKSNVLKFLLEDNCSMVVRPSGTEPKLKIYISVSAASAKVAEHIESMIAEEIKVRVN